MVSSKPQQHKISRQTPHPPPSTSATSPPSTSSAAAASFPSPSFVKPRRFNLIKDGWAASLGRKLHADCRKPSAGSAVRTERVGCPFACGPDEFPALVAIILPVVTGHLAQQPGYAGEQEEGRAVLVAPPFRVLHQELLKHLLRHLSPGLSLIRLGVVASISPEGSRVVRGRVKWRCDTESGDGG